MDYVPFLKFMLIVRFCKVFRRGRKYHWCFPAASRVCKTRILFLEEDTRLSELTPEYTFGGEQEYKAEPLSVRFHFTKPIISNPADKLCVTYLF
jgi:hypothetical protein